MAAVGAPRFCGAAHAPACGLRRPSARIAPGARASRLRSAVRASNSATATEAAGLIFGLGNDGDWDDASVGYPVVRYFLNDEGTRWFLWYTGRSKEQGGALESVDAVAPGAGSVGIARSSDGVNWLRGAGAISGVKGPSGEEDVGVVFAPNADEWWSHDTMHVTTHDVQVLSSGSVNGGEGMYWMFYTGGDFEPVDVGAVGPDGAAVEGLRMRPGLALSQDGRNWARIEGEHHSGAIFDAGDAGEWDELFVRGAQMFNAGPRDMRLFYAAADPATGRSRIGVATSPTGFDWTKKGIIFEGSGNAWDAMGPRHQQVIRDAGSKQYLMFYEGVAEDGTTAIGLATSKNGMDGWKALPEPVLTAGADGECPRGGEGPRS
ncbi:unnamed protein product [Pedinophyceae sp. YPF-701]|nr:unnamed protein product [Pedinophyceae sp. YPF-701]